MFKVFSTKHAITITKRLFDTKQQQNRSMINTASSRNYHYQYQHQPLSLGLGAGRVPGGSVEFKPYDAPIAISGSQIKSSFRDHRDTLPPLTTYPRLGYETSDYAAESSSSVYWPTTTTTRPQNLYHDLTTNGGNFLNDDFMTTATLAGVYHQRSLRFLSDDRAALKNTLTTNTTTPVSVIRF